MMSTLPENWSRANPRLMCWRERRKAHDRHTQPAVGARRAAAHGTLTVRPGDLRLCIGLAISTQPPGSDDDWRSFVAARPGSTGRVVHGSADVADLVCGSGYPDGAADPASWGR